MMTGFFIGKLTAKGSIALICMRTIEPLSPSSRFTSS
jgi:hypothetical protein